MKSQATEFLSMSLMKPKIEEFYPSIYKYNIMYTNSCAGDEVHTSD